MEINNLEITTFAPVVLPTLCRDKHLIALLESLSKCKYAPLTEVFVSVDYPTKISHRQGYERICKYLDEVGNMNFKKIHVIKREKNLGFGINGNAKTTIKYVLERFDRYIFTEDDNVFAPEFLEFINYNLEKYKDNQSVLSVSGYFYPVLWDNKDRYALKLEHFSAWGYGIWKDRYLYLQKYVSSEEKKKEIINNKEFKKKCMRLRPNIFTDMIGMVHGKPIWGDALYTAIQVRYGLYSIFPSKSLVRNMGWDGSGTHGGSNSFLLTQKMDSSECKYNYSETTKEINEEYNSAVYEYMKKKYIPKIQHILTFFTARLYILTGVYYNFEHFRLFWKRYIRR